MKLCLGMLKRFSGLLSMSFDVYIDEGLKALKAMENYMEVARRVKDIVLRYRSDAKVYVFGSVVDGRYTAASDIDILVVVDVDADEAYKIKAEVYREVDAPIQLHIVNQIQLQWYTRFTNKLVEV